MRVTGAIPDEVERPVNMSGTCGLDERIGRRLPLGDLSHAFDPGARAR
jgi:hypothetical protein